MPIDNKFTMEEIAELNKRLAGKTIKRVDPVGDGGINIITTDYREPKTDDGHNP